MEHRWGQRVSVDVVVRLIGAPGAIGTGRLLNVSVTGAFVQTELDLPLLTPLRVELLAGAPQPARQPCAGRAYVVRRASAGVGIEWFAVAVDSMSISSATLTRGGAAGDTSHSSTGG